MFDLDGTLVDSNAVDSQCYLQALVDIFGFDLDKIDRNWGNYPISLSGLVRAIVCPIYWQLVLTRCFPIIKI